MSVNLNKTGVIIQARMGSTRLPGKVLMLVNDKPLLTYQLERLKQVGCSIYIATTTKAQDDVIEKFAGEHNLSCFRGDEENVLKRYYDCAKVFNVETIVRVTSDCPLIDGAIIHSGIVQYLNASDKSLYLSNTLDRTFPRGLDFEVFSFDMLEKAFRGATEDYDKEHVTPYLWKNRLGQFTIEQVKQHEDFSRFRVTLDTIEDFKLLEVLIRDYRADRLAGVEICEILQANPYLYEMNCHIEQKKV